VTADLEVKFDSIDAMAQRLRTAYGEIEKLLAALDARANTLRAGWSGQASDAYADAQARWLASMRELSGVLDAAQAEADRAQQRFRQTEQRNAARWP
jgi:WXG100 family type VII secretion target